MNKTNYVNITVKSKLKIVCKTIYLSLCLGEYELVCAFLDHPLRHAMFSLGLVWYFVVAQLVFMFSHVMAVSAGRSTVLAQTE